MGAIAPQRPCLYNSAPQQHGLSAHAFGSALLIVASKHQLLSSADPCPVCCLFASIPRTVFAPVAYCLEFAPAPVALAFEARTLRTLSPPMRRYSALSAWTIQAVRSHASR